MQTVCPYCDEMIYESRARRRARVLALVLLMIVGPLYASLRGCQIDILWPAPRSALDGVLLALGIGIMLLPAPLAGITPVTRSARLWQVLRPLGGSLLWTVAAIVLLLATQQDTSWSTATVVLAITLPGAMIVLAWLAELPWRGLAAGCLIAAAWHGMPFYLA